MDSLFPYTTLFRSFIGDDARAGVDVAIFGGVRDRIAHVGDAALIHQVDDQLDLVEAFEIGHFRRVTGFDQGFERSEEHTSELQSLMRISYAVFCLKQKKKETRPETTIHTITK